MGILTRKYNLTLIRMDMNIFQSKYTGKRKVLQYIDL